MKTEHAARPQQAQTPQQGAAPQGNPAALKETGWSRRGDFESSLSSWSNSAAPTLADGQLFAQLLQPVHQGGDQSGFGGSGVASFQARPDGMAGELVDELTQRLPSLPSGPISITLLMPNLGRVQVRAGKRDQQLEVELGFERQDVLERLRAQEHSCASALSEALGLPVRLWMREEASV
ncbi:type III secretion system HrpP C-terminal domain-containing protein [Ectopseudomonas alcaliphila]|uniref:Hook-length control protein FliK n=1 Tax=Ectopseudomonas alcaliphila TaxID=101564 RepID=A0A1G7BPV9_9GAMM|nr:type III secretion system HrpP C-terminal domain-containing protein [Pseudomonas alcaliphila]MDX5993089.1 type III secretion system HrpP C-terminal domain-containing protein [Pseudomonas alcaliphila]SDE28997.1 hook-length control protein FliK [Pseudomonas alcaliphila]